MDSYQSVNFYKCTTVKGAAVDKALVDFLNF